MGVTTPPRGQGKLAPTLTGFRADILASNVPPGRGGQGGQGHSHFFPMRACACVRACEDDKSRLTLTTLTTLTGNPVCTGPLGPTARTWQTAAP